jgi:hypothetical protein
MNMNTNMNLNTNQCSSSSIAATGSTSANGDISGSNANSMIRERGETTFASFNFQSLDVNTDAAAVDAAIMNITNMDATNQVPPTASNEIGSLSIVRPVPVGHRRSISLPFIPITKNDTNLSAGNSADTFGNAKDSDTRADTRARFTNNCSFSKPAFRNLAFHSGAHSSFSSINNTSNNTSNGNVDVTNRMATANGSTHARTEESAAAIPRFLMHAQSDDDELDFLYSNRKLQQNLHHSNTSTGSGTGTSINTGIGSRISISPFEPLTKDRNYTYNTNTTVTGISSNSTVTPNSNANSSYTSCQNTATVGGKISPLPREEYEAWTRRRETQLQLHLQSQFEHQYQQQEQYQQQYQPHQVSTFRPVSVSPLEVRGCGSSHGQRCNEMNVNLHNVNTNVNHVLQQERAAPDCSKRNTPSSSPRSSHCASQQQHGHELIHENDLLKDRVAQLEQMLRDQNSECNNTISSMDNNNTGSGMIRLDLGLGANASFQQFGSRIGVGAQQTHVHSGENKSARSRFAARPTFESSTGSGRPFATVSEVRMDAHGNRHAHAQHGHSKNPYFHSHSTSTSLNSCNFRAFSSSNDTTTNEKLPTCTGIDTANSEARKRSRVDAGL